MEQQPKNPTEVFDFYIKRYGSRFHESYIVTGSYEVVNSNDTLRFETYKRVETGKFDVRVYEMDYNDGIWKHRLNFPSCRTDSEMHTLMMAFGFYCDGIDPSPVDMPSSTDH